MPKFFKRTLYSLLVFFLVLITAIIVIVNVIDPNNYKTKITRQIYDRTGYKVILAGKINWHFWPSLGLTLHDVTIASNPAVTEKPIVTVQQAAANLKLLPLLAGQQRFGKITLDTPSIYLLKNTQGKGNWVMANSPAASAPANANHPEHSALSALGKLSIEGIAITNGQLIWNNEQNRQQAKINNWDLQSTNLNLGETFPVKSSFKWQQANNIPPAAVKLTTKVLVAPHEARYTLNDFKLQLNDSNLTGSIDVTNKQILDFKFNLSLDQLNVDRYLPPPVKSSPEASKSRLDNEETSSANKQSPDLHWPMQTLRKLAGTGNLTAKKLIYHRVQLTNLNIGFKAHQGRLQLTPVTANAYEGTLTGKVDIDVRGKQPRLSIVKTGDSLKAGPLFHDMWGVDTFTGSMRYTANLTATGETLPQKLNSLNGNMGFAFKDGRIQGVDIGHGIQSAAALFKRQALPAKPPKDYTKFADFSVSGDVTNGIFNTNNLSINSPVMTITGKGKADLPKQNVDIGLLVNVSNISNYKYAKELQQAAGGIPLRLTGSMDHLTLRPDERAIAIAAGRAFLGTQTDKLKTRFKNLFDH